MLLTKLKFKNYLFFIPPVLFSVWYLVFPKSAFAHCPLCVGGAAFGLSVARFLGVDDAISGLWIAAFLGATALWVAGRFKENFIRLSIYLAVFALTIWSFYAFNSWTINNLKFFLINTHLPKIMGLDRLIFGLVFGGIYFYLVDVIDNFVIKRHGKVYFPYQRVFVSLGSVLVASIILFVFTL
jgi:hypothetical protein